MKKDNLKVGDVVLFTPEKDMVAAGLISKEAENSFSILVVHFMGDLEDQQLPINIVAYNKNEIQLQNAYSLGLDSLILHSKHYAQTTDDLGFAPHFESKNIEVLKLLDFSKHILSNGHFGAYDNWGNISLKKRVALWTNLYLYFKDSCLNIQEPSPGTKISFYKNKTV